MTPTITTPIILRKPKKTVGSFVRPLLIFVVCAIFIFPLLWMLLASLKTPLDIADPSATLAFQPTLRNYETVFKTQNFFPIFANSLIVAAVSTIISAILAVPAAYAISRFQMHKSGAILLLARIIPGVSLLVPWYMVFSNLGLTGGYFGLILSHMFVSLPLITWIMVGFFDGMPRELEEAAFVDGCTNMMSFLRISLPLASSGIATAGILAFIFSWNNFLFALVLSGAKTRTLPVAIFNFISYASIDWGGLMAASVVVTLPVMVGAIFAQKYIVAGLTAGATKG